MQTVSCSMRHLLLSAFILLLTGCGVAVARTSPQEVISDETEAEFRAAGLQPQNVQTWFRDLADRVAMAVSDSLEGIQNHYRVYEDDGSSRRSLAGGDFVWPTPTGTEKISGTRVITGYFNGGYKMFSGFGNGGQAEGQACMFLLEDGAVMENVIIAPPAADGVHCKGSCTLRNVYWLDVGEDAATFLGRKPEDVMLIEGGAARLAADKVFMTNGPGTLIIKNFYASNIGKLVRSCGNCKVQYQRNVVLENILVENARSGVVTINVNNGDTARIKDVRLIGMTKRCPVCTWSRSAPKGSEPTMLGDGPDGKHCFYDESTIINGGPTQLPNPNWTPSANPRASGSGTPVPSGSGGGYGRSPPPTTSYRRSPPPPTGYTRSPPPQSYTRDASPPPPKTAAVSPPPTGYPRDGVPPQTRTLRPPKSPRPPPRSPRPPPKSPPPRRSSGYLRYRNINTKKNIHH